MGFFELAHDMMAVATRDGYFRSVNAAWTRALGWSEEELTSSPYLDFVHPDDRDAPNDEAEQLIDGRSVIAFRNRYRCKEGGWRWLEWRAVPDADTGDIYGAARDVTEAVELQDRLMARERLLSRLLAAQVSARDQERQRVCNDLHDSAVQHLVAAHMYAEVAAGSGGAEQLLSAVHEEIRLALDATRRIMQGLDPLELGEAELQTAVAEHAKAVGQQYALEVSVELEVDDEPDAATAGVAYRIVREALTNAGKHSGGSVVAVAMRTRGGSLEIEVTDDGAATRALGDRTGGGHGIAIMRERAAGAGGVLDVEFGEGGTRVQARLPLRHAAAAA